MRNIFIFLLLLFSSSACYTQDISLHPLGKSNKKTFNAIQAQLSKADNLFGKFQQTQKMRLLSSPLISEGSFSLSKKNGLHWNQHSPFKSTLIVTPSAITQKIEENPPTTITKQQQPIVFHFTNLFLSLFNGNTKNVDSHFHIFFNGDPHAWKIALKPIGAPLNKAISRIEMSGSTHIDSVIIMEAKNNEMIIRFSNVKEA